MIFVWNEFIKTHLVNDVRQSVEFIQTKEILIDYEFPSQGKAYVSMWQSAEPLDRTWNVNGQDKENLADIITTYPWQCNDLQTTFT